MEAIKRIRRSESMWRELLARYEASGMSVLEFCRAEGIHRTVFQRWRSRLNGPAPLSWTGSIPNAFHLFVSR
jgi:hypothetical protein